MKRILLLFALFPCCAFGQAFEFGINGGISANTARIDASLPPGYVETGLQPCYAGSFNLLMNFSTWQLGISAEAYEMKTKYDYTIPTLSGDIKTSGTVVHAAPQMPILLTVNKLFYQRKSYIYFGLAGWSGINFLKNAAGERKYNRLETVLGAQLGYTYGLSNLVGLNINLAARYNGTSGGAILSFPLTVGLRIRP